jgi:hypothetical protein
MRYHNVNNHNHNYNNTGGGVGLFGLLGLLFIGLKLTGYIDWSWWLVLLPIYGGLVLFASLIALSFVMVFILYLMGGRR